MKGNQRIGAFDGIKGFAIILIVLYHVFSKQVPGGFLTVNTFFVLAGFFFTYKVESLSFQANRQSVKQVGAYIRSTFERLFFPLLWMMGAILIGYLSLNPQSLNYIRDEIFSGLFFYNNLYQIMAERSYFVQMNEASPFTHLWYNALYLQSFLLAIPIVWATKLARLRSAYKAILWASITLVSHFLLIVYYIPGKDPSRVYYGLDTRFSSFSIGIMLAYMLPSLVNQFYGLKHKRILYYLIGLVSLVGLVSMPFFVQDQSPETYYAFMPFYSVVSMGMIFSISVGVPLIRRLFSLPPLPFLGVRSYSYYLWYYPVIVFWVQYRTSIGNHWYYLGLFLSLVILAELTYQLVEQRRLIIPFVTSFHWKKDWSDFKRNNRSPLLIPLGFIFVATVGVSLYLARNDTPLHQFVFQRQDSLTHAYMEQFVNEEEAMINEVKTQVSNWEHTLDTYLTRSIVTEDYIKKVQSARTQNLEESQEINQLIADNQEIFDEIASYDPELAALVPPELQLFAAKLPVSFFGDSLILLSGQHATALFLDATVLGIKSLQVWYADDDLSNWIDTGQVQENLVINLGTNGGLDEAGIETLIEIAGDRKIFLVNTNSDVEHKASVNEVIHQVAEKYDNVYELDWYTYSKDHPEYYWEGEGIHHSFEGEDQFALFVAQELYKILGPMP